MFPNLLKKKTQKTTSTTFSNFQFLLLIICNNQNNAVAFQIINSVTASIAVVVRVNVVLRAPMMVR